MRYFDQTNRIKSDQCSINAHSKHNDEISAYNTFNTWVTNAPTLEECASERDKLQEFSTNNYMTTRDGYGVSTGCLIDIDSDIRKPSVTSCGERNQLFTRVFQAGPMIAHGNLNQTDAESQLLQGDDTFGKPSCRRSQPPPTYDLPLLDCVKNNIQNPNHIIPKWTRGGDATRDTLKQKEFLEKNGYQFDGTVWQKRQC